MRDRDYDNTETTQFNPVNNGYDDSDFDTTASTRHYAWENLPDDVLDGNWVSRAQYDALYDDYDRETQEKAILDRNYQEAYNQNIEIRQRFETLEDENSRLRREDSAASNRNEAIRRDLEQREKEFEDEKTKLTWLKIGAPIAIGILALSLIFSIVAWQGEKSDNAFNSQKSGAQQEQVTGLKSSLDQEKRAREEAESQRDELRKKLEKAEKSNTDNAEEVKSLKDSIGEKDRQIDELTKQINEIGQIQQEVITSTVQAPPETVTRTITQSDSGFESPSTVTTTVER